MKKLFYLDESEKKRILRLYEQKKEYDVKKDDLESILNIRASDKSYMGYGRRKIVDEIINYCIQNEWQPTIDVNSILKSIEQSINSGRYSIATAFFQPLGGSGRGVTDQAVNEFSEQIKKFKNIDNFCTAVNNSISMNIGGEENLMDIFDEINDDQVFDTRITTNIKWLNSQVSEPNVGNTNKVPLPPTIDDTKNQNTQDFDSDEIKNELKKLGINFDDI